MHRLLSVLCLLPSVGWAEVPKVVTDIAPIHSLTAQVMGDLGAPGLLLPPGADPHDFALRPSDARALGAADMVIWVGPGLTPWLEDPLGTLAPDATRLTFLDLPNWEALEVRDLGGHTDDDDHGHGHDDVDPHAWLDPATAQVWVADIAATLATIDPDNAQTYMRNGARTQGQLAALEVRIAAQLDGLSAQPYILPHDGYQYFEARFGLTPHMSIAGIDARAPGPSHIAALQAEVAQDGIVCVFSDAEIGDRWATLVAEGTAARTATLDGVGVGLDPGPALYAQLLDRMAAAFASCLADKT